MDIESLAPIPDLGPCRIESPLASHFADRSDDRRFVDDSIKILYDALNTTAVERTASTAELPGFEAAGPRSHIFFDAAKLRVGIVTCGGLCPGLNNVIAGLVQELQNLYGVRSITGFRNGYQGFIARFGYDTIDLSDVDIQNIRSHGGTILGTSRGEQDAVEIVDCLERAGIGVLFVIGGDGTMRGAQRISEEIARRGLKIGIVCIPKTIDNDIPYIDQSFGFQTAFAEASKAIRAGYVEATGAPMGVSLIKLMGRYSGFIACFATLADTSADFVLIPEVSFSIDGEGGLLELMHHRIAQKGHCVVVIAEGAGQDHFVDDHAVDASGNRKLADIGGLLRERVTEYFAEHQLDVSMKYIDPSYAIRSVAANSYDAVYCTQLAQAAVHAAMAGKTALVVGRYRRSFVHLPIPLLTQFTNKVNPDGDLWWSVLETTGQPTSIGAQSPA